MKTNTVRAIGRLLWAMAGFVVSLPAFGPALAGFIALWAIVTTSSGGLFPGIAAHRSDPDVHRLIVAAAISPGREGIKSAYPILTPKE
jgi:hypothetical protein